MSDNNKIFTLNIGSTSTKIALFNNTEKLFETNVKHDPKKLKECGSVIGQKAYRLEGIYKALEDNGQSLEGLDAVSARCGGTGPIVGGTYNVGKKLLDRLTDSNLHHHNADLGGIVAAEMAEKYGARAFFVDSPETDELIPEARITGMKGVYKVCSTHTLNQKAVCRFYADDIKKDYKELNIIVAHIGGGVSVSAHRKGLIVESTNLIKGDGPMAPTRCGEMQAMTISDMAFSGKIERKELEDR
ncbi:MAG: butyrate kinase, partial [Clostridia bacterium]|nr:butyrate kinase [Clostridia bacterium]